MQVMRGVRLGRVFGIPLVVHGSWFPAAALLAVYLSLDVFTGRSIPVAAGLGLATAAGLFVSVIIHELAHAQVARALGVPVRDITLFMFGGVSRITREPSRPTQEIAIAIAGPLASAILGGLLFLFAPPGDVFEMVAIGNVAIAVFNLLPGYPLDGGRILRAWLWSRSGDQYRAALRAGLGGQLTAIALIATGILGWWLGHTVQLLWMAVLGSVLYVLASSARRAARIASKFGHQATGTWARPFSATLTGNESVASVRTNGGGPYAVSSDGRLDGIVLQSGLEAATDALQRVRDVMVPWTPRLTCVDSLPLARALERLSVEGDLLVVLDAAGGVVGILDHEAVVAGMEAL